MSEDRSGYVYLLKARKPFAECYKIGRTKYPKRRFRDFGVRLPYEVEVVAYWPSSDCWKLEGQLHTIFEELRLEGEWFELATEHVTWIKSIALHAESVRLVNNLYQALRTEFVSFDVEDEDRAHRFYRLSEIMARGIDRVARRSSLASRLWDEVEAKAPPRKAE